MDLNILDEDGETLEDMLKPSLAPHKIATANRRFKEARTRKGIHDGSIYRNKAAVFVINTNYAPEYSSLEGPLHDLEIARRVFQARGYSVHVIPDSDDIVEDVLRLMEDEKMKETTDVFSLVYSGHGIHKTSAEKGADGGEDVTKGEIHYQQKGELGDCLVGTKGTLAGELFLSWQVSEELKNDASMCFFYDMCRNEEKVCGFNGIIF